jgi:glycosyltransferase involved in cell wall biosynthesis
MINNPIVSVVIPAYNEEEDIDGCVKTLVNQSYKPLEIIFVDDGSKDKTLEILNKYKGIKILNANDFLNSNY